MPQSLKDQNNWKLWLITSANIVAYYFVVNIDHIKVDGLQALYAQAVTVAPVALIGVLVTIINSVVGSDIKAKIVYLRWHNALPGHRAFSVYANKDPRVDVTKLKSALKTYTLPDDPKQQNTSWYKLYRTVENNIRVYGVHRDFLLLRDYTLFSILFLLAGSSIFAFSKSFETASIYETSLVVQLLVVRQAAAVCGIRMVTNVLALKSK